MNNLLLEIEGTWEQIAAHAAQYAGHRLRLTVLPETEPPATPDTRSLDEKLDALAARIPASEAACLPPDLTEQLDHYLSGTPKQ